MNQELIDRIKNGHALRVRADRAARGLPQVPDIPSARHVEPGVPRPGAGTSVAEDVGHGGAGRGDSRTPATTSSSEIWASATYRARHRRRRSGASTTPASTGAPRSCGRIRGSSRRLRCQYHSWTYEIDGGTLVSVPDERDFVDLDWEQRCLPRASCDTFRRVHLRQPGHRCRALDRLDRRRQQRCSRRFRPSRFARCTGKVCWFRATGR